MFRDQSLARCVCWLLATFLFTGWMGWSCSPPSSQEAVAQEGTPTDGGQENEIAPSEETSPPETQPESNNDSDTSEESTPEQSPEQQVQEEPSGEAPPEKQECNVPVDSFQEPGNIRTTRGWIKGAKEGDTWSYKGIPYAASPMGSLRWKPPVAHACWSTLRESTQFGSVCLQNEVQRNGQNVIVGSEDCLTLNVWTPSKVEAPLPVMVYIHGGAHIQGSSAVTVSPNGKPLYNGQYLAQTENVIVVTINYRLGAFGYFAHPYLSAESSNNVSGNYGILDQIFALRWVKDNIKAFGGDSSKVMIFGESAGAVSTCVLIASPLAKGLFHAALMQSGLCNLAPTLKEATDRGQQVVTNTSCKDAAQPIDCLRKMDGTALMKEMPASTGFGTVGGAKPLEQYSPLVDGWVLPQSPIQMMQAGTHNDVPFVVGSNAEEMSGIVTTPVPTKNAFEAIVRSVFARAPKAQVDAVLKEYNPDNYPKPVDAMADLLTDAQFTCTAELAARTASKTQTSKVWRYFFQRRAKTRNGSTPARHGIELLYVFGSLIDIPLFSPATEDLTLSKQLMTYWAQFARTGNPNPPQSNLTAWTPYDATKDNTILLDDPLSMKNGIRTDRCKLLLPLFGFPNP